ncbi:MAG: SCO family protein [Betaproteobacteria bacterium HGW-Betaproteobacteria-13]|jgi:protein SCO1/2|nr:MAG: SCO family protein [Betaproteobacteria bacterium HGW-Betaproteobacteria-19]PKO79208.1 MAG: SCO family protein [Betaproteobacteria bacterium HGW-Betaproteobacteria-13]
MPLHDFFHAALARTRLLRTLLVLLMGLFIAMALSACNKETVSFRNTDITGANFGHDFSLLDPDGATRSLADFRGKVVMMFFGFTQCPDICPTALSRAAQVRQLLGDDADKLQVIFVSVDPERDLPGVLKAYTAAFDPDFLGLYTSLEETRKVADEFRVFYRKVPTGGSYSMDHTATSYVFDPAGRLRLAVSYQSPAEAVAADVQTLIQTASSRP